MKYKYPPIYKYGLLFLIIYMFFKHQQIMSSELLLTNSIMLTLIVMLIDYIIIKDQPNLFTFSNKMTGSEHFDDAFSDEDIDEIINSIECEENNNSDIHTKTVETSSDTFL
jgi:hypothetical protein